MSFRIGMRGFPGATLAVAAASLWLSACMMGGTGTDTENGIQVTARIVGGDGAPMGRVNVQVLSLEAEPGSGSDTPLMPGTGDLQTDSAGYVTFTVKRGGQYMTQGRRGDTVLVLDTLKAAPGDTAVFHASAVQRLHGRIRLYSGYQVDTGIVFLRGSNLAATVTRNGEYDLGYAPASALKLTLGTRYSARPASKVFVRMADAGVSPVLDSRFSLDSSLTPAGGANLTLLKASGSATDLCLENGQQSLVPGISVKGSLSSTDDVMRAASYACSDKVGAQIQVDQATLAGKPLAKIGSYVLPDVSVWPLEYKILNGLSTYTRQKVVVPTACLQSGSTTNYATAVSSDPTGTQIRVDDIGYASGCNY